MTDSVSTIVSLMYVLAVLIALVFFVLFGLRIGAIWLDRRTRHYLRKHHDYFEYVKSHLHDEEAPLQVPAGPLTKLELKVIQKKLFEWMEKIVGVECDKLTKLCRDLGLVELNMRRLRSEIHWIRLDAAYNLGVMRAKEAVPALLQLLEEESYGAPAFVIARAIAKCAQSEGELDRMVRILAKHRKRSYRLVADVLALSKIDCTPLLTGYLRETDEELAKIALTVLQHQSVPGACDLLQPFVRSNDPALRLLAVQAIVRHDAQMAPEQMRELIQHDDADVRAEAADAFGQLGIVSAVDLLKEGMKDPDWRVRYNSARSLIRLGDTGFRALCEIAKHGGELAQASLANDVIQEELSKGSLYSEDLEQAIRHNRRLHIYRQFFGGVDSGMQSGAWLSS